MQQNYVNEKREGFRTRIRREGIESEFTKKRRINNGVGLEFPCECLEQILKGIDLERNLIGINNYLTQDEKRFLQSDQLLQLIPYALDHLCEENWSKLVVNLTFFMNGEQIMGLINLGGMNNLVKLLESDSMEDKDTYAIIVTNILCELPELNCSEFNKRYHCIEEICNSYATYGGSDELNEKYLGIIIYILRNTTIGELDKLCEVADNIAVTTLNSKIRTLSYRVLQFIFESNQQLFEIFERLNCIDQLIESVSGLQLLITLLQCNPMIMKQLIQQQLLLKKYTEILFNCVDYKMLKYIYQALREIFADDFDYEMEQQGLLLDALNKNIKNLLNQNIAIPNTICYLFQELVNSQHSHQIIMNMPIIQIVNTKLRDLDQSPMQYIDYLRMIKTIIEEGETIFPDYYVGQFIQYQGEQILCMIQNTGDDQCYTLAQELLTYFE